MIITTNTHFFEIELSNSTYKKIAMPYAHITLFLLEDSVVIHSPAHSQVINNCSIDNVLYNNPIEIFNKLKNHII